MINNKRKEMLLRQAEILLFAKARVDRQIEHLEKCLNEIKREVIHGKN